MRERFIEGKHIGNHHAALKFSEDAAKIMRNELMRSKETNKWQVLACDGCSSFHVVVANCNWARRYLVK